MEIHDPVRPTVPSQGVSPISVRSHLRIPFDNGVYFPGNFILHRVNDKGPNRREVFEACDQDFLATSLIDNRIGERQSHSTYLAQKRHIRESVSGAGGGGQ